MAIKILNTNRVSTVNSLIEGYKQKFDSPYNIHINHPPVPVDWYNQSKEHTSLDEATREVWDYVGPDSPVKYNIIQDAVIFGVPQMSVDWDTTDMGVAAGEISGETIVLPNTWMPYPNDFFRIKHIDKDFLFKVTNVTTDTFPNGANYYKVQFIYDKNTTANINKQVVGRFRMILDNVGTEYSAIVREDLYVTGDRLSDIVINLQSFYYQTFFKDGLQNFVYTHDEHRFYDPYMIEFLIRNNIMSDLGGYIHVSHELPTSNTFSMDYSHTIFRCMELRNPNRECYNRAVGLLIEDQYSIFGSRTGEYYKIEYSNIQFAKGIDIIDGLLLSRIKGNKPIYEEDERYKNIIINHLNSEEFSDEDVKSLETMDVLDSKDCFYYIPLVIYALSGKVKDMLKRV